MVQCYSTVSNSREAESAPVICETDSAPVNGPVTREAQSANQHCNYGEIWEKKKDRWKMKLLDEKKKVEWLKWIIIASLLIFVIFFVKK